MEDFTCTFISGAIGGAGLVAAGQPFDTVKTKLQTFPHLYPNGPMQCAREIFGKEGLRGLYVGSVPALMVNIAENSVLFASRTFTIGVVQSYCKTKQLSDFQKALAGSSAAFFSSIAVCPTELVKTRMQAATELSRSGEFSRFTEAKPTIRSTIKQILSEGYTAPFRGMTSTWGREMPGYFVLFYSYEICQNQFQNAALSGGIAGIGYWVAMQPVDVIKSRQQVLSIGSKVPIKFITCAKSVVQTSGFRGLYTGLTPMLLRSIPANGVLFGLVDYTEPHIKKILARN